MSKTTEPNIEEAATALAEILSEWRSTCKAVGIPYTDRDAAQFLIDAGWNIAKP